MSFFDSELVQKEMQDIQDLHEKIYTSMFAFSTLSKEDRLDHITCMEELINKQRILYTRLSLSDDPVAKEMKANLEKTAMSMGMPDDMDMNTIFNTMEEIIDKMKGKLDRA